MFTREFINVAEVYNDGLNREGPNGLVFFTNQAQLLLEFGTRVRQFRLLKGLSQEELGYRSELHRTYIGMIERGERNITLVNIAKIANALEIPLKDLL